MRSTWRNESPSVRGICGLTSARTRSAVSTAAAHDVDRDAEAHEAVLVRRAHLDERHVDADAPARISERNLRQEDGQEVGAAFLHGRRARSAR